MNLSPSYLAGQDDDPRPRARLRAPCITSVDGALCGRPLDPMQSEAPFITALAWFMAADVHGARTCPECLSVVRHALEQCERCSR